jgi:hypothetical protein
MNNLKFDLLMSGAFISAMMSILTLYCGVQMDSIALTLLGAFPLLLMLMCIYFAWDIKRER